MTTMNCHAYAAIGCGTIAGDIFDQRRMRERKSRAPQTKTPGARPGVTVAKNKIA